MVLARGHDSLLLYIMGYFFPIRQCGSFSIPNNARNLYEAYTITMTRLVCIWL
jgi:hypothetical protein